MSYFSGVFWCYGVFTRAHEDGAPSYIGGKCCQPRFQRFTAGALHFIHAIGQILVPMGTITPNRAKFFYIGNHCFCKDCKIFDQSIKQRAHWLMDHEGKRSALLEGSFPAGCL